ncbi:MAG: FtsX-like permease family protein [Bacillota bacterium]|nr:FtsX-like permease family protein [Bacillota bacterium]
MNNSTVKLCIREIKGSLSRYLAIFAIIALGAGLFIGLRMSRPDFLESFTNYAEEYNFYDIRLISTLGLTDDDVTAVKSVDGVVNAEGVISSDFLYNSGEEDNLIMVVHSIPQDINRVNLKCGRMPEKGNECLGDTEIFTEDDIGTVIKLSPDNSKQTFDTFAYDEYTLVGLCDSVLYINYERGTSTLGNGSVEGYIYVPSEGFELDCYTDIYVTVDADGYIYSDEYKDSIESYKKPFEALMQKRAEIRYNDVIGSATEQLTEARSQYEAGLKQYEPAKAEYDKGYAEFVSQKEAAEKQLTDAEKQLEQAEALAAPGAIEEKQTELDAARAELDAAQKEYDRGAAEFELMRSAAYITVNPRITYYENLISQREARLAQLDTELSQLNEQLKNAAALEKTVIQGRIAIAQAQRDTCASELKSAQDSMRGVLEEKEKIDAGLAPYENELKQGKAQIDEGYVRVNEGQKQLDELKAMLAGGGIEKAKAELEQGRAEANEKFAAAEKELKSAKAQLDAAKAELDEGKRQLDDAEKQIKNMNNADIYVLGRDANIGYVCFESDTEVVDSIAGVFPVFFFLVAALVCLTTMTRMIADERTQVGIMKALGYSSSAIMGKFLLYSGSATLFGCIFGIALGAFLFPAIVWFGYGLLYNISGLTFRMNWGTALVLTAVNVVGMLAVTWYCCYRELKCPPSELIRPKAPEAGKRILLERIKPLWNRLNFMQKVSARNIMRYKKRMFMIVVGVGGCTALVLTAFGLNDTINHVVSGQYDEVCHYDYELNLAYDMNSEEQQLFLEECEYCADAVKFLYCGTADVKFGESTKTVSFSATDSFDFEGFIDFKDGNEEVSFPGLNETIINCNLARLMGIEIGDEIEVVNADMNSMRLKVTGIFDNYVNHWMFVSMETCTQQWGFTPEMKSAYICAPNGVDIYENAERISEIDGVRSVSLCADTRARIENMLEGLAVVIGAIVICAGLLAFIVLYNLTNINISERIREIATIKVLGFYKSETASYVFRENMVLTGMGALFGLLLGIAFHAFVMNRIKVDMLYFEPYISPWSFVIAIVITFVFSLIVNRIMRRRIDNIDMAGALKSIE